MKNNTGTNYADTSYQLYLEKKDVSNRLEEVLSNYNDYQIDYGFVSEHYDVDYSIKLTFNHSFTDELNNDFNNMKSIIEILKEIDKNIYIFVDFKDYSYYYSKSTIVEKEKTKCKFMSDVFSYLNDNITNKYSPKGFDTSLNTLSVYIPMNIKEEYENASKEKYRELYKYMYNLSVENDISISLNFSDYILYINENYPNNIEDHFNKKGN